MTEEPYNTVDDQESLGEFKKHLSMAIEALKKAVQRGEETFYVNVLTDLEDITHAITAVERGDVAIAFIDGTEVPLEEILSEEIPPTPETTCCPSCGSTDLKDVIVKPHGKLANECLHCKAIFEPNYFVGDIEVEDLESVS